MKSRVVISPVLARKLLQMGNPIMDIKPNKNDVKATVFIFEETQKMKEDLRKVLED